MLLILMIMYNINDHYCCELLWEILSSKIPEASSKMWLHQDDRRKHIFFPIMADNCLKALNVPWTLKNL